MNRIEKILSLDPIRLKLMIELIRAGDFDYDAFIELRSPYIEEIDGVSVEPKELKNYLISSNLIKELDGVYLEFVEFITNINTI